MLADSAHLRSNQQKHRQDAVTVPHGPLTSQLGPSLPISLKVTDQEGRTEAALASSEQSHPSLEGVMAPGHQAGRSTAGWRRVTGPRRGA